MNFPLPRQMPLDRNNSILFLEDGSIALQKWNQKARAMQTIVAISRDEAEKLREGIEAAQHTLVVGRLSHLCDCDTFSKFGEHSPKCTAEIAAAKA